MTQDSLPSPSDVLNFWFGELDGNGLADSAHTRAWFTKDPEFDSKLVSLFSSLHAYLNASSFESDSHAAQWTQSKEALLASIIVLDQFSRNMFRDTPGMYASDRRALLFSYQMIALGWDKTLPAAHRVFVYMPFMHSEALIDQERCIELFESMVAECTGPAQEGAEGNRKYAVLHRDIVSKFNRFPHRNALLSRESSAAELEFLKQPGSSF